MLSPRLVSYQVKRSFPGSGPVTLELLPTEPKRREEAFDATAANSTIKQDAADRALARRFRDPTLVIAVPFA